MAKLVEPTLFRKVSTSSPRIKDSPAPYGNESGPDPKRAQMRKSRTHSKQTRFIEGWVEFADKKVARSVAGLLNAQPIGGKRGSRYTDDVWTMKYLPKFKWNMLSEQLRML